MPFTYETLNYLQRIGFNTPSPYPGGQFTQTDIDLTSFMKIEGYGRMDKQPLRDPNKQVQLQSEDVLNGLYASSNNLAFIAKSELGNIEFLTGCWNEKNKIGTEISTANRNKTGVLKALIDGSYPATKTSNDIRPLFNKDDYSMGGIVLGIPTIKSIDPLDGSNQMDRLIRSMAGHKWAFLLLAQYKNVSTINDIRKYVINTLKTVQLETEAEKLPSPLAQYYMEMLSTLLNNLTLGLTGGFWRTAVYLLGNDDSYFKLAGVWKSIFSGDQSLPESINVITCQEAIDLAVNFKLPDEPERLGHENYNHLYKYQTMLNSIQLAGYFHLPVQESGGFQIDLIPDFDAISPPMDKIKIPLNIGEIIYKSKKTNNYYFINLKALNRHTFISGITGAGKTNTIFILITQALKSKIPFLVIEPAKTEYRALLNDQIIGKELQIFTLGNELNSPFRVNPFEIVSWPIISVSLHIDLLRSLFSSSFGMWTPLPQILEKSIIEIYKDKGWDIALNKNYRLGDPPDLGCLEEAFPTLTDLALKIGDVIKGLGWEQKIADDMRTSLLTRINGLRSGGKGRMLDIRKSIPMELILNHPTVLELEGMGDDDDKAFMMGLIFIRLIEFRKAQSQSSELTHLLIIEEAHRLLTNVGNQNQEEANPRGKAVETFSNLLSEVRAYGQGIIVADQVPAKLAPDVIKNTNLKIAHRCVDIEDRRILAGAMTMNEQQSQSFSTFGMGEAAVFSEGDDLPILVKVPEAAYRAWPKDDEVRVHMIEITSQPYFKNLFDFSINLGGIDDLKIIELSKELGEAAFFQEKIARMVLSIAEDDNTIEGFRENLVIHIQQILREEMDYIKLQKAVLFFAVKSYANETGRINEWKYSQTREMEVALRNLLVSTLEKKDTESGKRDTEKFLSNFRDCIFKLYKRSFEPFKGCEKICDQKTPACLYRQAVAHFIKSSQEDLNGNFNVAYKDDSTIGNGLEKTLDQCNQAASSIVNKNIAESITAKRIALCYAQQILNDRELNVHDIILNGLMSEIDSQNKN